MIIDSHQHFWHYDPRRDGWITEDMSVLKRDFLPEDLLPELSRNHVEGCIAVQADQSEAETMFLLDLAEKCEEIEGVVGWVDLRSSELSRRLDHFSAFRKLRGFRHIVQAESDDDFMLRDDFLRGIGHLQRFGFTYDILIYPHQLRAAIKLAEKFPSQRFVLDHLAKPPIRSGAASCLASWSDDIRALAANSNVYCKISGLITEADWKGWRTTDFRPYLDVVFAAFGWDRLMFGSDWPVCLLAGTYGDTRHLLADYLDGVPAEQQNKIFGLNAALFYGLQIPGQERTAG